MMYLHWSICAHFHAATSCANGNQAAKSDEVREDQHQTLLGCFMEQNWWTKSNNNHGKHGVRMTVVIIIYHHVLL